MLLVVTDAAGYMLSAMKPLQELFYTKKIHVTCFSHGVHRLAEYVRSYFEDVNKLIAKVKSVFSKVQNRIKLV